MGAYIPPISDPYRFLFGQGLRHIDTRKQTDKYTSKYGNPLPFARV